MGVEWKLSRPSQKRVESVMWVSEAAPYKTSRTYPPASQRTERVQWVGWPSASTTLTLAVVRVVCAWCVFCLHGSLVLFERRQGLYFKYRTWLLLNMMGSLRYGDCFLIDNHRRQCKKNLFWNWSIYGDRREIIKRCYLFCICYTKLNSKINSR